MDIIHNNNHLLYILDCWSPRNEESTGLSFQVLKERQTKAGAGLPSDMEATREQCEQPAMQVKSMWCWAAELVAYASELIPGKVMGQFENPRW